MSHYFMMLLIVLLRHQPCDSLSQKATHFHGGGDGLWPTVVQGFQDRGGGRRKVQIGYFVADATEFHHVS
jgi:hypothetical protein